VRKDRDRRSRVHYTMFSSCRSSKLREQAIEVLRDLMASHDSDARYNTPASRGRIASIYLPLLSIIMDNYQHLYKGGDGWEDWSTTCGRKPEVRRAVVIKQSADGGWEIETPVGCTCAVSSCVFLYRMLPSAQDPTESAFEQLLGPVSTRNLLISFIWVLKNIDRELLAHWWVTLSISR